MQSVHQPFHAGHRAKHPHTGLLGRAQQGQAVQGVGAVLGGDFLDDDAVQVTEIQFSVAGGATNQRTPAQVQGHLGHVHHSAEAGAGLQRVGQYLGGPLAGNAHHRDSGGLAVSVRH